MECPQWLPKSVQSATSEEGRQGRVPTLACLISWSGTGTSGWALPKYPGTSGMRFPRYRGTSGVELFNTWVRPVCNFRNTRARVYRVSYFTIPGVFEDGFHGTGGYFIRAALDVHDLLGNFRRAHPVGTRPKYQPCQGRYPVLKNFPIFLMTRSPI